MSSEQALDREIFYLGYHLHWSYNEIMDLPIPKRKKFVRQLTSEIERQNEELENSLKTLKDFH